MVTMKTPIPRVSESRYHKRRPRIATREQRSYLSMQYDRRAICSHTFRCSGSSGVQETPRTARSNNNPICRILVGHERLHEITNIRAPGVGSDSGIRYICYCIFRSFLWVNRCRAFARYIGDCGAILFRRCQRWGCPRRCGVVGYMNNNSDSLFEEDFAEFLVEPFK
jgi:hypothetical protein